MKVKFGLLILASLTIICSCNTKTRYLDLNSNQYISLKKDSTTGYIMNTKTGEPVDVYVDKKTNDTIYGQTGEIVNGRIYKADDGKWIVKADGDQYKATENGAKIKIEGDKYKLKEGNYTVKTEGDGDVKIENGTTQTKIDGKTGERKTKKDQNITDKVKKIFH